MAAGPIKIKQSLQYSYQKFSTACASLMIFFTFLLVFQIQICNFVAVLKQPYIHIRYKLKQAGAIGCFLLLSFVLYIQAFHHHHDCSETTTTTQLKKLTAGKEHCSICDHITTRSISGAPEQFSYSLVPPQPQPYHPYSYYITIARELFIQAYTNKGPPSSNLFAI